MEALESGVFRSDIPCKFRMVSFQYVMLKSVGGEIGRNGFKCGITLNICF